MKKTLIATAAAAVLLVGGCQTVQNSPKQTVGGILGAAGGAVAGSQVGSGKGQLVGVALGTLAGAYLGSEIGRTMDDVDRMKARRTTQQALEYNRAGTTSNWTNPDSGHSGTVTPVSTYQTSGGQPCREYRTTVFIDGKTEEAKGTACRESDGTWRVIN